ncbi:MAG: hypothetical protein A3K25_06825 [Planctomycetes bacterium RIFOXYB12_FULL_42_10]|nr:MAG: hypothetical protein A2069_03280 [Planctomycetes bacterium GWB2_41_19]OHC09211.1 MAG: hypothetical protein A3K25_06825 [Planctomycetes bacterium RIFOXYB12_FULL_42_10]
MENVRNIAKNTLTVFFARGFNSTFGFLSTIVLARYLTVEEFGKFTFIYALIGFTVLLADFGGFHVITRELSKHPEKAKDIISSTFILRISIAILLLALVFLAIRFMNIDSSTKAAIYIIIIPQLIFSLNTIFVAVFTANNRFGFDALMQVASRGLEFLSIILVLIFNLGFLALFVAIGASYIMSAVLGSIVYLRNYDVPVLRYDSKYCKYLLTESLPLAITTFLSLAIFRVDIFVLKALKGSIDVALFSIPYACIYTLTIIPQSFVSVIFPILCKLDNIEERNTFIFAYKKALKLLYIISLPISILLICLSGNILQFIFGTKFLTSAGALKIIGASVPFLFLITLNTFSLVPMRKQHLGTVGITLAFFINLILDFLLIPKFGYIGASIATSISYGIYFILTFYFILQNLGRLNITSTFIKPIFAAGFMALFIMYFPSVNPFIILPASIIIYTLSLMITRVFSFDDIELAKSIVRPNKTRYIGN